MRLFIFAAALVMSGSVGAYAAPTDEEIVGCVVRILKALPNTKTVTADGEVIFANKNARISGKLVQFFFNADGKPEHSQLVVMYIYPRVYNDTSFLHLLPPKPYRKGTAGIFDSSAKNNPLRKAFDDMMSKCKVLYHTGSMKVP